LYSRIHKQGEVEDCQISKLPLKIQNGVDFGSFIKLKSRKYLRLISQKLIIWALSIHFPGWSLSYTTSKVHLKLLWHSISNEKFSSKFHPTLEYYLNRWPKLIMDFRYEANFFQSATNIEKFQTILQQYQEKNHALHSGPRIISSNAFLGNSNVHAYIDTYIKARLLSGYQNHRIFVCLSDLQQSQIKNLEMFKYWQKYVKVLSPKELRSEFGSSFNLYVDDITWAVNFKGKMIYVEHAKPIIQALWEQERRAPLLSMDHVSVVNSRKELKKIGLPADAWFVTLHVRDSGAKTGSWHLPDPYDGHRNADIETYYGAIKWIQKRGGYVVRVGDPSMKPTEDITGLIDYAHSSLRSSTLDLFLFTQCIFFVGTASGPILTPIVFGTPTAATNFSPVYARLHAGNTLTISKRYYSNSEERFLTLSESLLSTIAKENDFRKFKESRITLVDNTPEEILDLFKEMSMRVDGTISYSLKDSDLNNEASKLYSLYSEYGTLGRLGRQYLRNLHGSSCLDLPLL